MNEELIAPCGMNCAICSQYLALEHDVKSKCIKIPYCCAFNGHFGAVKDTLQAQINTGCVYFARSISEIQH